MSSSPVSIEVFRFGQYEANLRSRELRCDGVIVRLPDQSFEVLVMLLEHSGQLVTREEIQKRLWADDTFVDFDHGLNNAVKRLRDALGDSAAAPRFVETLTRRGYRFIGRIQSSEDAAPGVSNDALKEIKPAGNWGIACRLVAILALSCLVVAIFYARARWSRHPAIHSLAVLPFQNLSGDQVQDYFVDGMTDELITMLAKNPELRIISRTSAMQYKNVHRPLPDIARELGVDGVLEGSVGRSGSRVHVTAQLIYAPADSHIWAESYDRDLSDVVSLQSDLAQTIARQVGLTVVPSPTVQKRISPEAHEAYLLGRYSWFASNDLSKSRRYFERAIDLQQDYAVAWAGLADTYVGMAVAGEGLPKEVMPSAEAAARKALELDDSLAEAHNSMAAVYLFYKWDWSRAERESARAVELSPNFAEAHHLRGYVFRALNRNDEDLQEQRRSVELDPVARPWALGYSHLRLRQFDAALNEARKFIDTMPSDPNLHSLLSDVYWFKGMEAESAQEWEQELLLSGQKESAAAVQNAFRLGGFKSVIQWDLTELRKKAAKGYVSPLRFANDYGRLKHKEDTIRNLDLAYHEHAARLVFIQSDPTFDFLHSDPRYQAIIRNMGLPAAQ